VEALGNYDPQAQGNASELILKLERADYWIGVGAKPTDTVRSLIRRARALAVA
jgi:small subunit ribosomal protein S16